MLGAYNVNVNAVCPGMLWTSMWKKIAVNMKKTNPELSAMSPRDIFDRTIQDRMLLQREQTPEDVGRAVAFLASDDASEITGQALNVNGGALVD
jgi:NAD(P)-dependent dehydrogenase (short-subunit alcohol dehydrogenase family)